MNNPTIADAISSLRPNCEWALHRYDGLWWSDNNELPPPTEEELQEELERLKVEYEHNQYQRNRASAYPSIEDQLDTLYHQGYEGWKASIDEVKNKYPKPGEV